MTTPTTADPPRRPVRTFLRRWRWSLAAAAAALLAGSVAGVALAGSGGSGDTITVRGTLTLHDPDAGFGVYTGECAGSGGYDDIRPGAQVTVTAPDGTVLAIGELGTGTVTGPRAADLGPGDDAACRFPLEVADVPAGHELYGIEVAGRGVVTFPEDRLGSVTDGPVLTLG